MDNFTDAWDAVVESAESSLDVMLDSAEKEDVEIDEAASVDVEDAISIAHDKEIDDIVNTAVGSGLINDKDIDDIEDGKGPSDPIDADAAKADKEVKTYAKELVESGVLTESEAEGIINGESIPDAIDMSKFSPDKEEPKQETEEEKFFNSLSEDEKLIFAKDPSSVTEDDDFEDNDQDEFDDDSHDDDDDEDHDDDSDDTEDNDDSDGEEDTFNINGATIDVIVNPNNDDDIENDADANDEPSVNSDSDDSSTDDADTSDNDNIDDSIPVVNKKAYHDGDGEDNKEMTKVNPTDEEFLEELCDDDMGIALEMELQSVKIQNDFEGSGINAKEKQDDKFNGSKTNPDEKPCNTTPEVIIPDSDIRDSFWNDIYDPSIDDMDI